MINYKLFKDNGFNIKSIRKINTSYVVSDNNKKYVIKNNRTDLKSIFDYLSSRNFNNFPKYYMLGNYDVFDYLEDSNISIEERLTETIGLLTMLHLKTTRYKNVDIDDYKKIFEQLLEKIDYLNNYYVTLNDAIDNEIYMAPSHYLLVRNISKVYGALSFCKRELDSWYELIENSSKQRAVLVHNNLDLSHVLYNKVPYLISWNKAKIDLPIYDLVSLYDKYYNSIDFSILLNNYMHKYPLSSEELKLFFILISVPIKIEFTNNEMDNIITVKSLIEHINKSDKLIRPYYSKENQKISL